MSSEVDIIRRWIDSKELARDLDIRLSVACDQFELGDILYNDLYEVMAVLRYEEHRQGLEEESMGDVTCASSVEVETRITDPIIRNTGVGPWDYIQTGASVRGIGFQGAVK